MNLPPVNPPRARPLLVFDGRCSFCRLWIERWKRATGDTVEYAPSSEAAAALPGVPAGEFARSVVLVRTDGSWTGGALAAIEALKGTRSGRALHFLHRKSSLFRSLAEGCYRGVAGHRDEALLVTRLLWGATVIPPGFSAAGWLFLRGLAVVYAVAFASLAGQIAGLVGSNGISPAEMLLEAVHAQIGSGGILYYPTLAWIDPGDGFLTGMCAAGIAAAVLLFLGAAPRLAAAACWVLYFSLFTAGQVFLQFQWDILLLEAGFLAIFAAPGGFLRPFAAGHEPPRAVRWLLWLLLFRLMFMSGVVKLTAGDPNWWNLTALSYHYETQCLPNPVAWHLHHLPLWFHRLSALGMFLVEIGAPLVLFTPRRLRHLGAFLLIGLQLVILVTGNFAFFNWLSIVLCLPLLDDGVALRLVPRFLRERPGSRAGSRAGNRAASGSRLLKAAAGTAFAAMLALNLLQLGGLFVPRALWPRVFLTAAGWASHFHLVNGYGLFRVMTTKRPEIVIEGSRDRAEWIPYEFRYKPGDPARALPWVAPHQPRLDWQMWFAALGDVRNHPWLVNLAIRLLEGSPEVLSLLEANPFPDRPPAFVRALLYEYRFATPEERDRTGALWIRTLHSVHLTPMSLDGR